MKISNLLKRIALCACITFTVFVYLLYLLRSAIPSVDKGILPLPYLNGFLLFGAVLGLTNGLLSQSKLQRLWKRLIHFAVTAVNFFVSITLVTGYLTAGNELTSPLTIPNRILYCAVAYVIVYFICVGVSALVRVLLSLTKRSGEEYQSVLSK